jgi:porin
MPHDTRTDGHQPVVKRRTLSSMAGIRLIAAASAWTVCGAWLNAALAAPPSLSVPTDEDLQTGGAGSSFVDQLGRTSLLLGDMGGLRTELAKYGISLAIQETSEVLGNVTGGITRARPTTA